MAENWGKKKRIQLLFRRFLCIRIKIVLLTSDLLSNISLVVGQSSVNISLALRARDISTSWLTSNQWYIGQQWIYHSRFALMIYPLHDWPTSDILGNKSLLAKIYFLNRDLYSIFSYLYLSYDAAVIQWITSCHKNRMTTRYITLGYWRVMSWCRPWQCYVFYWNIVNFKGDKITIKTVIW